MTIKLFTFILGLNICGISLWMHDFHISKSDIKYKSEEQVLQMSVHIFIDDLESALKEKGVDSLYIGTEKEVEISDKYIQEYLREVLLVSSDTTNYEFDYLGKELSNDLMAIWCYLEIQEVENCDKLQITNKILLDLYDDQKNIVAYSNDRGVKDYFILDYQDQIKDFSCE